MVGMVGMVLSLLVIFSAAVSFGVTYWIFRNAQRMRLVQEPNYRSSHVQLTPNGGGLGIVLTGTAVGIWLAWGQLQNLWVVIGLALPLAIVGLLDDIYHLSARLRLGAQVATCSGLLALLGNMPEIVFTLGRLSAGEGFQIGGWVLSALLLLVGVWWINLFNFMDGIDGIAGAQAVFMLLAGSGLVASMHADVMVSPVGMLMLSLAASTAGFLLLNWPPARIFMGDVGSTWLAFMIFVLALLAVQAGWIGYTPWVVLSAAFVTDATVTLLTRIARGERWYEAHRCHVYQKLARRWGGHRPVTLLVGCLNVLWLAPLAGACVLWPQWALELAVLAYGPLVVGAVALGAGRREHP